MCSDNTDRTVCGVCVVVRVAAAVGNICVNDDNANKQQYDPAKKRENENQQKNHEIIDEQRQKKIRFEAKMIKHAKMSSRAS